MEESVVIKTKIMKKTSFLLFSLRNEIQILTILKVCDDIRSSSCDFFIRILNVEQKASLQFF